MKQEAKFEQWVNEYRESALQHVKNRMEERLGFILSEDQIREVVLFLKKLGKPYKKSLASKTPFDNKLRINCSKKINNSSKSRKKYWYRLHLHKIDLIIWVLWDITYQCLVTIFNDEEGFDPGFSEAKGKYETLEHEFEKNFQDLEV